MKITFSRDYRYIHFWPVIRRIGKVITISFLGREIILKAGLILLALALSATSSFSQTNIFNLGPSASDSASYVGSDYIFNVGFNPSQYATYRKTLNVFNLGADCGWQCNLSDSWNIFNVGFASGEFVMASKSHNIFLQGSETGRSAMFYHSGYHYLFGHNAGDSMISYKSSDVYALGGLQGAQLYASKNVASIGNGAGNRVKGSYTNVVFIGDGSTLGPQGKDLIVAGPKMKLRLGSTNEWQFGEVIATPTNNLIKVNINGQDHYLMTFPYKP